MCTWIHWSYIALMYTHRRKKRKMVSGLHTAWMQWGLQCSKETYVPATLCSVNLARKLKYFYISNLFALLFYHHLSSGRKNKEFSHSWRTEEIHGQIMLCFIKYRKDKNRWCIILKHYQILSCILPINLPGWSFQNIYLHSCSYMGLTEFQYILWEHHFSNSPVI